MTNDLITRLRTAASQKPDRVEAAACLESEAADELERLRAALKDIAALDDKRANKRLDETDLYDGFDEPVSVYLARDALGLTHDGDGDE